MNIFLSGHKDSEGWWTVRTLTFSLPLKVLLPVILGIHVAIYFPVISLNFFNSFFCYIEICDSDVIKYIQLFLKVLCICVLLRL